MVQNPCGAPVAAAAHAVVRGVAAPVVVVVVVAEALRGVVAVAVVHAEVLAAAAVKKVPGRGSRD